MIAAGAELACGGGVTEGKDYQNLRMICTTAGGALYAARLMPLLKTNLLTLEDIDPNSVSSLARLRNAGLSDIEVRMLALHLLSLRVTNTLSMDEVASLAALC
eukprot:2753956-Rhodomonas_salina.4